MRNLYIRWAPRAASAQLTNEQEMHWGGSQRQSFIINVTGNMAGKETSPYANMKPALRSSSLSALPCSYTWCLIQITQRRQNHQTHMLTWKNSKNKGFLGQGSRVFLCRKKEPLQITCAPVHVLLNFWRMTQIPRQNTMSCSVKSLKRALGCFHTRTIWRI